MQNYPYHNDTLLKNLFFAILLALSLTLVFILCYGCYKKKFMLTSDLKYFKDENQTVPPVPDTSTAVSKIEELRKLFQNRCAVLSPEEGKTLFGKMCSKVDKIKIREDKQSYTINKEKIYLCLTDETKNFYSNNMLVYVLLHEFAHTLCKSVGHTPEFHEIFEQLLKEAIEKKLYDPDIPVDPEYCKHNKPKNE